MLSLADNSFLIGILGFFASIYVSLGGRPSELCLTSPFLLLCCAGTPAAMHYGTGAIFGFYSEDQVTIGDLVVQNQVLLQPVTYEFYPTNQLPVLILLNSIVLSGIH